MNVMTPIKKKVVQNTASLQNKKGSSRESYEKVTAFKELSPSRNIKHNMIKIGDLV